MLIANVKFGETHAVTALGDIFKGKQPVDLSCHAGLELSYQNENRLRVIEGVAEQVSCVTCRLNIGLDQEDETANAH